MEKYKARENNINPDTGEEIEKSYKEQKQESVEKGVDVLAESALDAYTGGQFSQIKNGLSSIPVVGGMVDDTWNKAVKGVSSVVSETPAGDILKKADDAGVTDMARTAKDTMNFASGSGGTTPNGTPNLNANAATNSAANSAANGASASANSSKSSFNLGKSNNSNSMLGGFNSNGGGDVDFTKKIMDSIPSSLKIKIYASCFVVFMGLMMFMTVFADPNEINMGATNSTNMSTTSGTFTDIVESNLFNGNGASMPSSGQTLLGLLGQEKLEQINAQIKNDVMAAGIGTGAGVAKAAYDFIKLLLDNGINMTYTYGGEHGVVKEGLQGSWGYGNGLDCSSFVSWALYNGGCKNHTTAVVSGTQATYGVETTADQLKAGDVIANDKHVMLVLTNSGNSVIVAHASSTNVGIVFSERSYESLSQFHLRDMTTYYQTNCSS